MLRVSLCESKVKEQEQMDYSRIDNAVIVYVIRKKNGYWSCIYWKVFSLWTLLQATYGYTQ